MKKLYLSGCGTAMLTPFKDGYVDYDAFAALTRRQVEAGVDFLVPLGTTGETPCLADEEKVKVLVTVKENAAGLPVTVGGGSNNPKATVENIRLLEKYGADAFLVVVPYYNKPTQEGQYLYFKAIAESTDKPIVIYNVPSRSGANMNSETTLRLAGDFENIVAVKEASSNYRQISEILRCRPEGFSVLSGNDEETLSLMATGADGIISVASNVAPKEMSALVKAMQKGDLASAREMHYRLMPLFKACFVESNPIPAKAAMAQLGLMRNELRLPLVPASAQTEELLKNVLKDLFEQQ